MPKDELVKDIFIFSSIQFVTLYFELLILYNVDGLFSLACYGD